MANIDSLDPVFVVRQRLGSVATISVLTGAVAGAVGMLLTRPDSWSGTYAVGVGLAVGVVLGLANMIGARRRNDYALVLSGNFLYLKGHTRGSNRRLSVIGLDLSPLEASPAFGFRAVTLFGKDGSKLKIWPSHYERVPLEELCRRVRQLQGAA